MKVLINRKPVRDRPWGGGAAFINAFVDFAPNFGIDVTHDLVPNLDGILIMDPRYDELGVSIREIAAYSKRFPSTKIIHRINECDARKGAVNDIDPLLNYCSTISHESIFVSNWIEKYHRSANNWQCANSHVIYNGIDDTIFKPGTKIRNGKINIVAHHWSDNWLKGGLYYEFIDHFVGKYSDDFQFTYIGRHKCKFKNTTIINPLFGAALGNELGKHDVYVTGTRYDPGPNHVLEALACGLPVLAHIEGGGAVEFAPDYIYQNTEDLATLLINTKFDVDLKMSFRVDSWQECIKKYCDVFKER